jgi:hypothetical protein
MDAFGVSVSCGCKVEPIQNMRWFIRSLLAFSKAYASNRLLSGDWIYRVY